jgi:ATP-dependent helicase/nuclease subunit A
MTARNIPTDVLDVQRAASDPAAAAWVAANAGSGKTHVLAQRVIRLLLRGTPPEKILCLTYTKAAAANMANRVFETLAKWTPLSDAELDARIDEIEGQKPDARRRTHARRLFAKALDTPGGLKVQTIHAFCTRLLHQFPFEADVAARFEVLEERTQSELTDRLRMSVLLEAAAKPDGPLGRALATAITMAADQTFAEVVTEAIGRHGEIDAWIKRTGSVAAALAELSRVLGVRPEDTMEAIAQEVFSGSLIAPDEYPAVIAALEQGQKGDKEHAARFDSLRLLQGSERIKVYNSVFCTADLEPRKNIVTKAIRERHPSLFQRLLAEQERVCALIVRRRAVEARERTAALVTIAAEVIARYRAEKNRRGLLDYDDLIDKTLRLLGDVDAAWVHYKLDLGIDHVLIDEAQDTSAPQWEIVAQLVAEFAAGAGARAVARSIFAVGDEKQSIFSFQGAEPRQFDRRRGQFQRLYEAAGLEFRRREFKHSFRSGATILAAVDTVFRPRDVFASVTTDADGVPPHIAVRTQSPGLVELWPMTEPEDKPEIEGWAAPFDETSEASPRLRLAQRIAATVRTWIDRRLPVGDGRAARPGDILVLVRQRGALFEAVISELKKLNIDVAGADRLVLTQHIAVMDLMALADALLLGDDDLALASVLKSPLFGLTEEQLFALAYGRKGSLRAALRMRATDLEFADINARLERYADWARQSPFSFYARILGSDSGRGRFYARLGPEAADALDEFLEHALTYEREEAPTLQGFLAWLRAGDTQVKRDMDIARDEVRVMTVHGAKGLEAPIVILADTTTPPKGPREPRLLALPFAAGEDAPAGLVWAGRKADDPEPVATARATAVHAAEDEYRRLLYVAMTRAADRLVIAGSRGVNRIPEGCWYQLIETALKDEATEEPADHGTGTVWRWRVAGADAATTAPAPADTPRHDVPDWLRRNASAERSAPHAIAPSRAHAAAFADAAALARGRVLHRLLQALPVLPPDRRAEAARHHVARVKALADDQRQAIVDEVLRLLEDARFAALFAAPARVEVPIAGRLANGTRVSGVVDRLAVTANEVLIADYKSDRVVPASLAQVPQAYVGQLALYRAVLRDLYPNHRVRAALVWTAGPALTELPEAALDQALSRLKPAQSTKA